jgi:hypothetical protein
MSARNGSVVYLLDGSNVVSDHDEPSNRRRLEGGGLVQISNGPEPEDYVTVNAAFVTVISPAAVTSSNASEAQTFPSDGSGIPLGGEPTS